MMQKEKPFHGSYQPTDVQLLLDIVDIEMTPVNIKESLIQSGKKHYSDMLSQEANPTQKHLDIFRYALEREGERLATDVVQLASTLAQEFKEKPIILVSLVRAGIPLGVMLHRALQDLGVESYHYGISIIRDRGIDHVALNYIERKHGVDNIVFVDGWTGKGAISQELHSSLGHRKEYKDEIKLVVLTDPCGMAWLAASDEDWLIPFGIMGAPVSGLISRSIWADNRLHGCVLCDHLKMYDVSQELVDYIDEKRKKLDVAHFQPIVKDMSLQKMRLQQSRDVIQKISKHYGVDNINRIKPGIAEATRAVLRRVPDHILVKNIGDLDIALLKYLAEEKGVTLVEAPEFVGNYRAITIIKKVS